MASGGLRAPLRPMVRPRMPFRAGGLGGSGSPRGPPAPDGRAESPKARAAQPQGSLNTRRLWPRGWRFAGSEGTSGWPSGRRDSEKAVLKGFTKCSRRLLAGGKRRKSECPAPHTRLASSMSFKPRRRTFIHVFIYITWSSFPCHWQGSLRAPGRQALDRAEGARCCY